MSVDPLSSKALKVRRQPLLSPVLPSLPPAQAELPIPTSPSVPGIPKSGSAGIGHHETRRRARGCVPRGRVAFLPGSASPLGQCPLGCRTSQVLSWVYLAESLPGRRVRLRAEPLGWLLVCSDPGLAWFPLTDSCPTSGTCSNSSHHLSDYGAEGGGLGVARSRPHHLLSARPKAQGPQARMRPWAAVSPCVHCAARRSSAS